MHRCRVLAVEHHRVVTGDRSPSFTLFVVDHHHAQSPPLLASRAVENSLQPGSGIHHRTAQCIAGERQSRDRCPVGIGSIRLLPVAGPPAAFRLLPDQQPDRRCRSVDASGTPLAKGHHREPLHFSDAQVGISLSHDFQRAIGVTQQPGAQAEVCSQTIKSKSSADQLLVGGRNPGHGAVHIGQQGAVLIEHGDAPGADLGSNHRADRLLQGLTGPSRLQLKRWSSLLMLRRRGREQCGWDLNGLRQSRCRRHQPTDAEHRAATEHALHSNCTPLTVPFTRYRRPSSSIGVPIFSLVPPTTTPDGFASPLASSRKRAWTGMEGLG